MALVRYFAAAADAAGCAEERVASATVGDFIAHAIATHGSGFERVVRQCSFLLDGDRVDVYDETGVLAEGASTPLTRADTLDVLPPFAGG